MNDFVGVYDNALPKSLCDTTISWFESMHKIGLTRTRQQTEGSPKYAKNDTNIFMGEVVELGDTRNAFIQTEVKTALFHREIPKYFDEYDILKDNPALSLFDLKAQKTTIGGGYHTWHYESFNRGTCNRVLAFIFYLNDVEEGGETEFLYYPKRVKPQTGRLLVFPCGFPHTHRGNPPLSGDKYILTGWLEL